MPELGQASYPLRQAEAKVKAIMLALFLTSERGVDLACLQRLWVFLQWERAIPTRLVQSTELEQCNCEHGAAKLH